MLPSADGFTITVEVVPPAGPDAEPLLADLEVAAKQPFEAFNVASNPLAKPRMSALVMCTLIQQRMGKSAIMHCTSRDHNSLSIHSLLSGAKALGIETILAATGDFVALGDWENTANKRDVNVFDIISKARELDLQTGVVLDPAPGSSGFTQAVRRLNRKVKAGAQFVITQPIYDEASVDDLEEATQHIEIPLLMGILPLRTARHAEFLHHKVTGITVPTPIRERMSEAEDTIAEGAANAREMLTIARKRFAGACIMPPFDHYNMLSDILSPSK
jgi:homocysteine S-methyltransferase